MRHCTIELLQACGGLWHLRVLAAALTIDLICIFAHVALKLAGDPESVLFVNAPRGVPEFMQYGKEGLVAGLLARAAHHWKSGLLAAWSLLFGYLMVDDWLELHERLGFIIAEAEGWPAVLSLRPRDLGEIAASGIVVGVFVSCLGLLWGSSGQSSRAVNGDLMVLLAALGFFGVFVDVAHIALEQHGWRGLTLVEDGGEMVVMSLILAYAANLLRPAAAVRRGALWRMVPKFGVA